MEKHDILGCGGGQAVSVLAFYCDDQSLNLQFLFWKLFEKDEKIRKNSPEMAHLKTNKL